MLLYCQLQGKASVITGQGNFHWCVLLLLKILLGNDKSTVYWQHLPGDKLCLGQVQHRLGHILRRAMPGQGRFLAQGLHGFRRHPLHHIGENDSWGNGIHPDAGGP